MLIAENISHTINERDTLKGINFIVKPGELVALLGANGAGKSTLIKLLSTEYKNTKGAIRLHGRLLTEYNELELALIRATMVQQPQIAADFTVEEVVLMGRYPHFTNSPKKRDLEVVQQTMSLCGIDLFADRSILSLSGGERQRVHLARILAQVWDTPQALLLLDEPISALDLQYQHQTLAIAKALAEKGWMVICVLHDINIAAQYAHRLLLMKNGRKMMDGTPHEVLNTRNVYTIFGIDAEIVVNPRTLRTYIIPKEVNITSLKLNKEEANEIVA